MSKVAPLRKKELSALRNDRKFGTDGIRGPVTSTMNPLFVTKLGWAAGSVLKEEGITKVLIGKDTRISGYMFESALQAGFISSGMDVTLLGPLPTPGVSYLANSNNQVGLVISASHNLFEDNGIKFFNKDGQKFSEELEKRIESKLTEEMTAVESINLGKASRLNDAQGRYVEFCKSSFTDLDLNGLSILLDCANGATYSVAPKVFEELGASVKTISASPDGININQNCGSTNPDNLKEAMSGANYDLGIAFDGDGDRILIVTSEGEVLDGDDILYILSRELKEGAGVVGTLMTNKSLEIHFKKLGIQFKRADVGDKYVAEALRNNKWMLGGENSGHIVLLDKHSTGDGIISALQLLAFLVLNEVSLNNALKELPMYPQELINIPSNQQLDLESKQISLLINEANQMMDMKGRILIRPSGTQPIIRVMTEGPDSQRVSKSAQFLAENIEGLNSTEK